MNLANLAATRHGSIWLPWRTLLLTGLALGLFLGLGDAPEAWVFDRTAITQGEWWRLITGHWVHSDPEHATWDIGALLVLGILFESRLKERLFSVLLIGSLGIDIWLWFAVPSLSYYCGLSGILNSLLALGLFELWRTSRHPLVLITAAGAILKIVWETSIGSTLLTTIAWPSLPAVHGVGFICGLLAAWLFSKAWRSSIPIQVFIRRFGNTSSTIDVTYSNLSPYRSDPALDRQKVRRQIGAILSHRNHTFWY